MEDGLSQKQKEMDLKVRAALVDTLKLPEPIRSQGLTCLAYEYFIQDMEEKAFQIIAQADPEYFKKQMAIDMVADPRMEDIVKLILQKLISGGYAKLKVVDSGKEE